jgi:hypothetical protein
MKSVSFYPGLRDALQQRSASIYVLTTDISASTADKLLQANGVVIHRERIIQCTEDSKTDVVLDIAGACVCEAGKACDVRVQTCMYAYKTGCNMHVRVEISMHVVLDIARACVSEACETCACLVMCKCKHACTCRNWFWTLIGLL